MLARIDATSMMTAVKQSGSRRRKRRAFLGNDHVPFEGIEPESLHDALNATDGSGDQVGASRLGQSRHAAFSSP